MFQISKLGLEKEVIKLKAKGLSNREVASKLNRQFGVEVSHMAISRFKNRSKDADQNIVGEKKVLQEELARQKLDIYQQLNDSNKVVRKKIEELENSDDHYALQGYLKELRAQLEFNAKLLGELNPKISIEQTITYMRSNIIEIISTMPEEAQKELAKFLVQHKLIDPLTKAYMINEGMKGFERHGYCMIKADDQNLINSLEEQGKIKILRPV